MCELRVTCRGFLAEQDQLMCSRSVDPGIYLVTPLSGYQNTYLLSKIKLSAAREGFLRKKGAGNEIIGVMKTERKGERSREEMKTHKTNKEIK
jgi:hypothetical protein